ncbi:PREDICTED: 39S ribosomal protein L44, mitochondrial [Vollenhovia emeryi]|uniref:39S ribosomal protein L44, mitochondrial n=1 Tax=Vollenhovia emeryi TaxID=411798 RepID=UPI0005F3FBDC|nr:PREDICTED: 39S ribosomal protein L44, mitochondrial [Vollenhovia emeryi]XP_011871458.1 PREDICTED: 39S ribosomal protein L44, mitochondrial [Vollenhovia emeryi]
MNVLRSYVRTVVLSKGVRSANYEGQRCIKRWVAPTQIAITSRKRKLGPQPPQKRNAFLEWNRFAEIFAFNRRLSESFDMEKLDQAFTHKSYLIREGQRQKEMGIETPIFALEDNTELIKKGDDLTSTIVTISLAQLLPRAPEEVLNSLHDYLLSEEILAKAAFHIGTKDIILTEEHPVAQKTLADTFLALVAVLAESVDANHAAKFVRDFLISILAEKVLTEVWNSGQPVQVLNGLLQAENKSPVEPRLIGQTGQNTLCVTYHVAMYSDKQFLGSGFGQTIQEAKEVAALNVLSEMFGLSDSSNPIQFNKPIKLSS